MNIFACHLLNDYSGSPKVLMQLVKGWTRNGIKVTVLTSKNRQGFLSNINNVDYNNYKYNWHPNAFIRLCLLICSQVILFLKILGSAKKDDIVYINTVLPFGAAIAGWLKGATVIYHVHETSIKPIVLKSILFGFVKIFANDVVYVSEYLKTVEAIPNKTTHILHNAIESSFLKIAQASKNDSHNRKNVLMVSSLKKYKGIDQFVALATLNNHLSFELVLNACTFEIDSYFKSIDLPKNITIYPSQTNTHPFYAKADLVLNLSIPNEWIETFGLTLIEAMAYGIPTIAPPVGGVTEIVQDGETGYLVDSRDIELLSYMANQILQNDAIYNKMSFNARVRIENFGEDHFIKQSLAILKTF